MTNRAIEPAGHCTSTFAPTYAVNAHAVQHYEAPPSTRAEHGERQVADVIWSSDCTIFGVIERMMGGALDADGLRGFEAGAYADVVGCSQEIAPRGEAVKPLWPLASLSATTYQPDYDGSVPVLSEAPHITP